MLIGLQWEELHIIWTKLIINIGKLCEKIAQALQTIARLIGSSVQKFETNTQLKYDV